MLTIYRQTGQTRDVVFRTYINKGCKAVGKLMDDCSIKINFSSADAIVFKVGDYIDLKDASAGNDEIEFSFPEFIKHKYVLKSLYYPTYNTTTGGYDYEMTFVAFWQAWGNKIYKFSPSVFGQEAKWSLVGTLSEHLKVFLNNMVAYANEGNHLYSDFLDASLERTPRDGYNDIRVEDIFEIDNDYIYGDESRHVFVSYEGKPMSEVFSDLCAEDKFDCDWWYKEGKFHFGKCEDADELIDLSDSVMASSDAMNDYANRIICFGGERNLTARYRKDLLFHATDIISPPEGNIPFSGYRSSDYSIFVRDKDKKDLTADIIRSSEKRNGKMKRNVSHRWKSFSTNEFVVRDDYGNIDLEAKYPFGRGGVWYDYEYTEGYEDKFIAFEQVTFGSDVIHIGMIGSRKLTIESNIKNVSRHWFTNNPEHFYDDELGGKRSRELGVYALYTMYELMIGNNVVGRTVVYTNRLGSQYNTGQSQDIISTPTGGDFLAFDVPSMPVTLTFDVDEMEDYSIKISYGVKCNASDMGVNYLICDIDGDVQLSNGAESAIGVCTLEYNGRKYDAVFNPMGQIKSGQYYSYFGLKENPYFEGEKEYKLDNIVFGKVKVNYFTQQKKGDTITNTIINRNLMLPELFYLRYNEVYENGEIVEYGDIEYSLIPKDGFMPVDGKNYIDAFSNLHPSEVIEKLVVDSEVFPMMYHEKVYQVGLYNWYDDEESAHEVAQRHYQYAFNTSFNFSEDCIIEGQTLKVRFTSGALNGMEFEVKYHRFATNFQCVDGTNLLIERNDGTSDGNSFVIIPNEDYGLEFPNDTCHPKTDDEFILIGFDPTAMPEENNMVTSAEERLLGKMVSMANQVRNNSATYTATVPADTTTEISRFYIGRRVKIKDVATKLNRMSRIIGYDINLDFAYDHPVFTIGQSAAYSRLRTMQKQTSMKSDGKLM